MKKNTVFFICFILAIATIAAIFFLKPDKSGKLNAVSLTMHLDNAGKPTQYQIYITSNNLIKYYEVDMLSSVMKDKPDAESYITKPEFAKLTELLDSTEFLTLPEEISRSDEQGSLVYIEADYEKVVHKVGGYMPMEVNEDFDSLYRYISTLATKYKLIDKANENKAE